MKKNKTLILLLLVCASLFILTSCGSKTAITSDDFKTKMEADGYTIVDATDQFSGYEYINNVYLAVDKDKTYQIEFYDISTEEYADGVFQNNKSIFEDSKGSTSAESSTSVNNYETYSLSSNDTYKYISRVDNTMLYVDVSSEYKDTVKEVIDKLGY